MSEIAGVILLVVLAGLGGAVVGRRRGGRGDVTRPARSAGAKIARLEGEERRAREILEGMSEGVLVLSTSMTPVLANRAARRLLALAGSHLPPRIPSDEVVSIARRALSEQDVIETDLGPSAAGPSLRVRVVPLGEPDGVVVFLHDATEEQRTQQLRRQFVAHASHELKTPVASLQTLVEAIASAADDRDATARFTQRLSVEIGRLNALIDDLMDLSRVEDPAAMRIDEVDLSEIARSRAKETADTAAASVTLESNVEEGVIVRGDARQLELLVRNLLDNAVRYTLEGGRVIVSLRKQGSAARLEVADDGIGIPLAAQSRIFERFYRVDEDRARASGGTGLGLSIVKNVAESHGGTVSVSSELDEGSTFTVMLPLADGAR
ncbi:MAG TPA: ATP-binding protein [Actinomycetota bacterium]|nr:ATP-binding protein [Actinomycetota bacterium]